MTSFQKIVKYFAIALAACLIVGIVGGIYRIGSFFFDNDGVLDESRSYSLSQDFTSIKIEIAGAELTISNSDSFSLESNLKYLSVEEKDGVLILTEAEKHKSYRDAVLNLTIPRNLSFENIEITTGAGRLTADTLTANALSLELGAGESELAELNVINHAKIEGGTGNITVKSGTLHNLDLSIGVGQLDMTARLEGSGKLDCGIGNTELRLIGTADDYCINLSKGLGNVTLDGVDVKNNASIGNGEHKIALNSGIGNIRVQFTNPSNH